MVSCSVVIVSHYTGPALFDCLKSIFVQRDLAEVVLVDNGNWPDIQARLLQMRLGEPRLKIVSGQGNIGAANANNLGVSQAQGDYLLFLNPDCLLPPDALSQTIAALDEIPGSILAGATIIGVDGSIQSGVDKQLVTPENMLCSISEFWSRKPKFAAPEGAYEVEAVAHAFMCIRAGDFKKLGGFDEGFFLQGAKEDLCMRVHTNSGKMICAGNVQVKRTHYLPSPVPYTDLEWLNAKDFMHYFTKHFKAKYYPGTMLLVHAAVLLRYTFLVIIWRLDPLLKMLKR